MLWSGARFYALGVLAASQQGAAGSHPAPRETVRGLLHWSTSHIWWVAANVPSEGQADWHAPPQSPPSRQVSRQSLLSPLLATILAPVLSVGSGDAWRCRSPGQMKPPHCSVQGEGAGLCRPCTGKAAAPCGSMYCCCEATQESSWADGSVSASMCLGAFRRLLRDCAHD